MLEYPVDLEKSLPRSQEYNEYTCEIGFSKFDSVQEL
jgi:hypothetical protein